MKIILVSSQTYQNSRHLLQNPKVPRNVMGFSNRAQRFTGPNYLDVDNPFGHIPKMEGGILPHFKSVEVVVFLGLSTHISYLTTLVS